MNTFIKIRKEKDIEEALSALENVGIKNAYNKNKENRITEYSRYYKNNPGLLISIVNFRNGKPIEHISYESWDEDMITPSIRKKSVFFENVYDFLNSNRAPIVLPNKS